MDMLAWPDLFKVNKTVWKNNDFVDRLWLSNGFNSRPSYASNEDTLTDIKGEIPVTELTATSCNIKINNTYVIAWHIENSWKLCGRQTWRHLVLCGPLEKTEREKQCSIVISWYWRYSNNFQWSDNSSKRSLGLECQTKRMTWNLSYKTLRPLKENSIFLQTSMLQASVANYNLLFYYCIYYSFYWFFFCFGKKSVSTNHFHSRSVAIKF